MSSYLYYRKAGSGPDGWVISTHLDENMLMVTTRAKVGDIYYSYEKLKPLKGHIFK